MWMRIILKKAAQQDKESIFSGVNSMNGSILYDNITSYHCFSLISKDSIFASALWTFLNYLSLCTNKNPKLYIIIPSFKFRNFLSLL